MKKKFLLTLLILLVASAITVSGCEKNNTDPPSNGSTDTDPENGTENSSPTEDEENVTETDKDASEDSTEDTNEAVGGDSKDEPTYPPSDPSDPYENDKHWDLP